MSWVARVTVPIDMMVSAALPGDGRSVCSYSILIFPFGLNTTCSCLSGDPVAEITQFAGTARPFPKIRAAVLAA
jgi:hypothetical protein